MAHSTTKKKPVAAMIVMGVISIALYATLLLKQDLINSTFAKGGLFAFLPIVTAFVFSYFHGAFTGHFWTVLGVEAARKKKEVK
jgi:F0F1-type ATP synthase assembly protein I